MSMIVPRELHVEVNASCQLRCPTCPTTEGGYPPAVGSGRLRFDDFKRMVDDNPQLRSVYFECRGELFLNGELVDILKYGYEKKKRLYADSGVNLNAVFPGALEALVKYKLRTLLCSIDGATPETYAVYRRGGDFNRVIEHLRAINDYKRRYRSRYPELTWQFVVFGHNEHELPLARSMAAGLGMHFSPKRSWDSKFSPVKDRAFVKKQTGWSEITREEYEAKNGSEYMRDVCAALWESPRVNWNGKILGCCWNSWADFGGNAFTEGYIPASNSDKINYARAMLLGRVPPRDDIPCARCANYSSMKQRGNFMAEQELARRRGSTFRFLRGIYRHLPAQLPTFFLPMIDRAKRLMNK
jgi:MoaA/NifB/PqqE/SkfB family radical SAM enzyme